MLGRGGGWMGRGGGWMEGREGGRGEDFVCCPGRESGCFGGGGRNALGIRGLENERKVEGRPLDGVL